MLYSSSVIPISQQSHGLNCEVALNLSKLFFLIYKRILDKTPFKSSSLYKSLMSEVIL